MKPVKAFILSNRDDLKWKYGPGTHPHFRVGSKSDAMSYATFDNDRVFEVEIKVIREIPRGGKRA